MWIKVLGSIGFLCCFLYDINSITRNNRWLKKFFFLGMVLIVCGTAGMFQTGWSAMRVCPVRTVLFGGFALVMFAGLIYTLFFALPFETTYVKENQKREAYTEGMYALCRHPGVLWFIGLYLCIAGMAFTRELLMDGLIYIGWNTAYIVLQDLVIFPQTFWNYGEYRSVAPFLIPNRKSIRRCLVTFKERKAAK